MLGLGSPATQDVLSPLGRHLHGADTAISAEVFDAGSVAQQGGDLAGEQVYASIDLVEALQAAPHAVARKQPRIVECLQAVEGESCVRVLVKVKRAQAVDDVLGDHVEQGRPLAPLGVDRGAPQRDAVLLGSRSP